jgi:hypothetical protein
LVRIDPRGFWPLAHTEKSPANVLLCKTNTGLFSKQASVFIAGKVHHAVRKKN